MTACEKLSLQKTACKIRMGIIESTHAAKCGHPGFGSMNAPYSGGMFVTKPFIFEGSKLHLNYATGAPGSIRVGIIADGTGWPASGYSTEECDIIYGNELDAVITWKGDADLSKFAGKTVALKFEMKDADLYAFRFGK